MHACPCRHNHHHHDAGSRRGEEKDDDDDEDASAGDGGDRSPKQISCNADRSPISCSQTDIMLTEIVNGKSLSSSLVLDRCWAHLFLLLSSLTAP